jgi:hypothetical protein
MAVNNNGTLLDSAGRPAVDFVWGSFPLQPNDERTETAASNIGGSTGDTGWSATTQVTGARLDFAGTTKALNNGISYSVKSANHELDETAYSGYPSFTPGTGKYQITQVSGDGTTITFQSFNFLTAGDTVVLTGVGDFNSASATVATATRDNFTITAATTGSLININNGIVALANQLTAADGAYVAGVAYIDVPNVLGETTALALDELKDAGYATANITTASAAANAAGVVTAAARTAGSGVTTITDSAHGFVTGNKVTLTSVDATVNGTYTVTRLTDNTFTVTTTATTVLALTGLTGAVVAVAGTIKSQSTAAGTASVALSATITITPWATAS